MLYDNHSDIKQNYDISKVDGNSKIVQKYKEKLKVMREFVNKKPF